jgi:hypothetical protein
MIGYIPNYHGIGTDGHVVADSDPAQHFGTRADIDAVSDRWCSSTIATIRGADRDALRDVAVATDSCAAADPDATQVPDIEPRPDRCRVGDRDAELEHVVPIRRAAQWVERP